MSSDGYNKGRHFVSKSWGYEDWIANSEKYCGKVLFLKKDKHLSLHYHNIKDETFYVQSGEVCLTYYDDPAKDQEFIVPDPDQWYTWPYALLPWNSVVRVSQTIQGLNQIILRPGDSFHIPVGLRHTAYGLLDSYIFEFSTQHFDEDSIRIIR